MCVLLFYEFCFCHKTRRTQVCGCDAGVRYMFFLYVQICLGGAVPESYYLNLQNIVPAELLNHVNIPAGKATAVEFAVDKPSVVLK